MLGELCLISLTSDSSYNFARYDSERRLFEIKSIRGVMKRYSYTLTGGLLLVIGLVFTNVFKSTGVNFLGSFGEIFRRGDFFFLVTIWMAGWYATSGRRKSVGKWVVCSCAYCKSMDSSVTSLMSSLRCYLLRSLWISSALGFSTLMFKFRNWLIVFVWFVRKGPCWRWPPFVSNPYGICMDLFSILPIGGILLASKNFSLGF